MPDESESVMPSNDAGTDQPKPGMTTRLSDSLIALGEKLPESHRPAPHTVPNLLAGMLYWLETGSVEPPELTVEAPVIVTNKDAEIAALQAELAAAKAGNAPAPIAPTSVIPPSPGDDVPAASAGTAGAPDSTQTPPPAVPVPPVGDVPSAPVGS